MIYIVHTYASLGVLLLALSAFQAHGQFTQEAEVPAGAAATARAHNHEHRGWYVHPKYNRFLAVARKHNTDKVTAHNYQTIYGRAFELPAGHVRTRKFLEIGLGCNMGYGPGHSAKVWKEYLPETEIWFAEYDAECVKKHQSTLDTLGIKAVTGDQADVPTLLRWLNETGGGFDVIIDDGGHSNMQIYNSFITLFDKALKPGGLYVVEDIWIARTPEYVDGDKQHFTIDIFKDWLDDLVMRPGGITQTKWERPKRIKLIECSTHYCAFVKCFDDDAVCDLKRRRLADDWEQQPASTIAPHDKHQAAMPRKLAAATVDGHVGGQEDPAGELVRVRQELVDVKKELEELKRQLMQQTSSAGI